MRTVAGTMRVARLMRKKQHRFDFSGNGESGGEFRYTGYEAEVADLRAVVQVWV